MREPLSTARQPEGDLLLARRCGHDPQAREQLFRCHAPAVYRVARRLVGNAADAEDVVQEAFIQALGSIGSYRGESSLSTWLHRVAVRCAMRYLRRARRPVADRVELESTGNTPGSLTAQLESRATLRRVEGLVERLAASRRAVFVLHEIEGYSLPEVASLLGISVTAAKKRVWRARRDLEKLAGGDPALAAMFVVEREDGGDA